MEFQLEQGLKGEDSGPDVDATPSVFCLLQKARKRISAPESHMCDHCCPGTLLLALDFPVN